MGQTIKIEPEIVGKTFDDFLLRDYLGSLKHRSDASLKTKFSRNITLNLPIVSANMDTVTEGPMAIAMAKSGGIGIVHRNLTIDRQAKEVRRVKRAENFIIEDPWSLLDTDTIGEARLLMEERGVGTVVVVNKDNQLKGIFTTRDLRFFEDNEENNRMPISKRMTTLAHGRLHYHRGTIRTLEQATEILRRKRIKKLPLVDGKLTLRGLITAKDIEGLIKYPFANKDSKGHLRVGAAIGVVYL